MNRSKWLVFLLVGWAGCKEPTPEWEAANPIVPLPKPPGDIPETVSPAPAAPTSPLLPIPQPGQPGQPAQPVKPPKPPPPPV